MRKGENIYKRKDGRWEGRFIKEYDPLGKARYGYVYAKSYSETKAKMLERRSGHVVKDTAAGAHSSYGDLMDLWLDSVRMSVKESTYARYRYIAERRLKPVFGGYPAGKIDVVVIERYTNWLLKSGRLDGTGGLGAKTVSDILAIMKQSLKYARHLGLMNDCALDGISVKKSAREMRVLTTAEQERLSAFLRTDMDPVKLGVFLCLYTGLRIGEVCALKWKRIDLDAGVLKVRETLQRIKITEGESGAKTKISITEPKSRCSARDIPLPQSVIDTARPFSAPPEAYLLTGRADAFIEPRIMQNRFKKYLKSCDVAPANFHSLRHTFATRCVELGFEVKSLSEILGHANVNITLNRYVHSSIELKRVNMSRLDDVINSRRE